MDSSNCKPDIDKNIQSKGFRSFLSGILIDLVLLKRQLERYQQDGCLSDEGDIEELIKKNADNMEKLKYIFNHES